MSRVAGTDAEARRVAADAWTAHMCGLSSLFIHTAIELTVEVRGNGGLLNRAERRLARLRDLTGDLLLVQRHIMEELDCSDCATLDDVADALSDAAEKVSPWGRAILRNAARHAHRMPWVADVEALLADNPPPAEAPSAATAPPAHA